MVLDGWAVAFVKYDDRYLQQEKEAKQAKRGVWVGDFVQPAKYRSQGWQEAEQVAKAAGSDCRAMCFIPAGYRQ